LLRWHCRLGHISFRRVQFLMRSGVLSNSESGRRLHTAACKLALPPKYAACQYGKQTRRPAPGTKTTVVQERAGVLKRDHLLPGQRVFAGAGAHLHNGNAERAIQTIMLIARTMMLHSAIHWPDVADPMLWPMAVQQAVFLHNHVADDTTGLAPSDVFTRTRWPQRKLHDLHVWGCPVYLLEKVMADSQKLPRWKPRAHCSVNMGLSPQHASTVPLVLNPETGSITPHFHVVFDDWFATVASEDGALPDFNSPEWSRLFVGSTFQFPFDESKVDGSIDPTDSVSRAAEAHRELVARAMDVASPSVPLPVAPLIDPLVSIPREPPVLSPREPPVLSPREPEPTFASLPSVEVRPTASDPVEIQATPPTTPAAPLAPPAAVPSSVVRRSSRVTTAPSRLGYDGSELCCSSLQPRYHSTFSPRIRREPGTRLIRTP